MSVFVVTSGEYHQGGGVEAIFYAKPSDEVVLAIKPASGGEWVKVGDGRWDNQGDWLSVNEWEIQ